MRIYFEDRMTDQISTPLAPGLAAAIAAAAEAANLPRAERMKQHRKNLRSIGFYQGLDGVAEYKLQFPEAETIRVDVSTLAYSPKPAGYGEYLVRLAERWLESGTAAAASNQADVERLNERFGTAFPPGKHFSEPLSTGRRKKIKAMFAKHGIPLDLAQANTMSKVRGLAKAARAMTSPQRQVCKAGVIEGTSLVMGNQHFPIERNGDRECIRVTINGKRRRFYLDELDWLAGLLVSDGADPLIRYVVWENWPMRPQLLIWPFPAVRKSRNWPAPKLASQLSPLLIPTGTPWRFPQMNCACLLKPAKC
jgi:hypothetical protein